MADGPGAEDYEIFIGSGRIVLPASDWRKMDDEAIYAKNFEAVQNDSPPRVSGPDRLSEPDE